MGTTETMTVCFIVTSGDCSTIKISMRCSSRPAIAGTVRRRCWLRKLARTFTAKSHAASRLPRVRNWRTRCIERSESSRRARSVAASRTFRRPSSGCIPASLANFTRCTRRCIFRRSTTPGCPLNRCQLARWWTGICGSGRPHGDRSIWLTATVDGEVTGTSIQEPACSTGELIRSISVSGPIRPTTQCRSNMNPPKRTSSADTPTA